MRHAADVGAKRRKRRCGSFCKMNCRDLERRTRRPGGNEVVSF